MSSSTDRTVAFIAIVVAFISCSLSAFCIVQVNAQNDGGTQSTVDEYERVCGFADTIRERTTIVPEVAIVLGSGLSSFIDGVDIDAVIPYSDLKGFPISTVPGHNGNFVLGKMSGLGVIIMQGRVHYYEGYSLEDVVLPIRVMHELGAKMLLVTNASGSLNPEYEPGSYMLIRDHICMLESPMIGKNISQWGERFFPMNDAYDSALRSVMLDIAGEHGFDMSEGVYIQVTGPQYETPAEIKMYQSFGADAVGMSTTVEVIAARHMGMNVCGVSCLTNWGAGMSDVPPTHEEVQEMTAKMAANLRIMVYELLERVNI